MGNTIQSNLEDTGELSGKIDCIDSRKGTLIQLASRNGLRTIRRPTLDDSYVGRFVVLWTSYQGQFV